MLQNSNQTETLLVAAACFLVLLLLWRTLGVWAPSVLTSPLGALTPVLQAVLEGTRASGGETPCWAGHPATLQIFQGARLLPGAVALDWGVQRAGEPQGVWRPCLCPWCQGQADVALRERERDSERRRESERRRKRERGGEMGPGEELGRGKGRKREREGMGQGGSRHHRCSSGLKGTDCSWAHSSCAFLEQRSDRA